MKAEQLNSRCILEGSGGSFAAAICHWLRLSKALPCLSKLLNAAVQRKIAVCVISRRIFLGPYKNFTICCPSFRMLSALRCAAL